MQNAFGWQSTAIEPEHYLLRKLGVGVARVKIGIRYPEICFGQRGCTAFIGSRISRRQCRGVVDRSNLNSDVFTGCALTIVGRNCQRVRTVKITVGPVSQSSQSIIDVGCATTDGNRPGSVARYRKVRRLRQRDRAATDIKRYIKVIPVSVVDRHIINDQVRIFRGTQRIFRHNDFRRGKESAKSLCTQARGLDIARGNFQYPVTAKFC